MDYTGLFATFLAAHKRVEQGDSKAAVEAQTAAIDIINALKDYNPYSSDLFGGQVETKDADGKALFEECWKEYRRKGSKKKAYEQWKKMKDDERQMVMPHLKAYVGSREICYQKDFERYLRDATYKEIIVKGNMIIYDPQRNANSEYKPEQSYSLIWSATEKMFVFVGYWDGKFIPDGYNDDNRPDGAKIMLNNGRGIIQWSAMQRQWDKV